MFSAIPDSRFTFFEISCAGDGGAATLGLLVLFFETQILRDALGRPIEISTSDVNAGVSVSATGYHLNFVGWKDTMIETENVDATPGDATGYVYNARGQILQQTDPQGQITETNYNVFGQTTEVIRPGDQAPTDTYTYDGYGRPLTHTKNSGEQIGFGYDSRGDQVSMSWLNAPTNSYNNVLSTTQYDLLGRVVRTVDNNLQRLSTGQEPQPVVRRFHYDRLSRVANEWLEVVGQTPEFRTRSYYSLKWHGWKRRLVYPSGKPTDEIYDHGGRLSSMRIDDNRRAYFDHVGYANVGRSHEWTTNPSVDPLTFKTELDGFGRPKSFAVDVLDRNSAGTPTNTNWSNQYCFDDENLCSTPLYAQHIRRDVLGRVRTLDSKFGNPELGPIAQRPQRFAGYEYSLRGHLRSSYEQTSASNPIDAFGIPGHYITNADISNYALGATEPAEEWRYNREPKVGSVSSIENPMTNVTRFVTENRGTNYKLGTVAVDQTEFDVTHDDYGRVTGLLNLMTGDDDTVLTFGPLDRLASVEKDGETEHYLYDASGRMVATDDEVFLYDGPQIIETYGLSDGQFKSSMVWGEGLDQLLEFEDHTTGSMYVPITDHRNSVVGWWDSANSAMGHQIHYNPEGRMVVSDSTGQVLCEEEGTGANCLQIVPNLPQFGFNTAWKSRTSGLIYMRNRWYAPRLGQFISHDPLGTYDSSNMYAFVGFDPINSWDPWGLAASGFAPGSFCDTMGGCPSDNVPIFDINRKANELADKHLDPAIEALHKRTKPISDAIHQARQDYCGYLPACHLPWWLLGNLVKTSKDRNELYFNMALAAGTAGMGPAVSTPATAGGKVALKTGGKIGDDVARQIDNTLAQGGKKTNTPPPGAAAAAAKVCSFTEGTLVLMCSGEYKEIQDVEEGDWVLARDETTGEVACKQVVDPYENPDRSIILVTLLSEDGSSEVIETTDNHPFYVEGQGWLRVDELTPGDFVPSSTGALLTVIALEWTDRIEPVYNFGVRGFHTYFVGELGAWVHNCTLLLGLNEGGSLFRFAEKHGYITYKDIENKTSGDWMGPVYDFIVNSDKPIVFNLSGVDDPLKAVSRASMNAGGATDWELMIIYTSKESWDRITWVVDDVVVSNPFQF